MMMMVMMISALVLVVRLAAKMMALMVAMMLTMLTVMLLMLLLMVMATMRKIMMAPTATTAMVTSEGATAGGEEVHPHYPFFKGVLFSLTVYRLAVYRNNNEKTTYAVLNLPTSADSPQAESEQGRRRWLSASLPFAIVWLSP